MSGNSPVGRGWKAFFWAAATYNIVIGLDAFLDASWGSPDAVGAVLIFCFGIVYALVAHDPRRFAPVLVAGIVGKGMVIAMLAPQNWFGNGEAAIGLIVAGDLLFALGFAWFLMTERRNA
ncbi:hypothetical protein K3165_11895 [Qipengyuania sp. 1XM1-15A]|uniref:hypothetical protein n=1 Tax=Qipengyuania xiamenensis TaxID=2867237 RepID=UPI001C87B655|nr:hypothetical protein [Qipengyuania xiamenensis]MBX7533627.1 hypothetical protein [Qipengyuania xiamenensis]